MLFAVYTDGFGRPNTPQIAPESIIPCCKWIVLP